MSKKNKIILTLSIVTVVVIIIMSGSFAYFGWFAEEESLISVTISSGNGSCALASDNKVFIEPSSTRNDGRIIKLSAKQEMGAKASINWNMVVNEIGGLQDESFLYELINSSTGVSYGSGNFADIQAGDTIVFSNSDETLNYNTEYEFTLYLWIDGENFTNPTEMADQEFDFDISCQLTSVDSSSGTNLIEHITNLYTGGNPTLISQGTSGDTYYYSYQDVEQTWGLMNDGLKVDTTQDATTTGLAVAVTDTTKLTSGTEGNIRYFGPSDSVNNYIYFNCETYPDTNCELWRIIGIVDGKVKIIRNESIGDLSWDQDKNQDSSLTTYSNNWETSSLQLMLNSSYYNGDTAGTITYYLGPTGTTTSLDMSTLGIKNDTTRNMISSSIWYLGGYSLAHFPYDFYLAERLNVSNTIYSGNPFTIEANIGLMYASDYAYATNLTLCATSIDNYDNTDCKENNWLYKSGFRWSITPSPEYSYTVWWVGEGIAGSATTAAGAGATGVNTEIEVLPVLYLNSELTIEADGEGTSTNPYRISVN